MRLEREGNGLWLSLSADQLRIVVACIGASFATISPNEYGLLIGASMEDVESMTDELCRLLKTVQIDL